MRVPIVVPSFGAEEEQATLEVLRSGWIGQGPKVEELEKYVGQLYKQHCVAMHSCTGALHLALLALNVQPGDTVLVPGFTFVATANAVEYCGAKPVLVDVDPTTFNINVEQLAAVLQQQKKSNQLPKALMLVHEFGLCADMQAIQKVLQSTIPIVEDAACAFGATYRGKEAGSFGTISCFSLHPRKVITSGEGGFLLSADAAIAERTRRLRNHGLTPALEMPELGFNYRMTDLQAALALVQIKKGASLIAGRQAKAKAYDRLLSGTPWLLPKAPQECGHSYQSYVVRLQPDWLKDHDANSLARLKAYRDAIIQYGIERGVGLRISAYAIANLAYFKKRYDWNSAAYPGSLLADMSSIALPIYDSLSDEQQSFVVEVLAEALKTVRP